jgi:hypothetical protein
VLRLKRILWTAVAVCFLAVSWLWDTLAPLIRAIIDLIPLERVKQAVIAFMDRLEPYPTLAIFLIPLFASEPIKVGAFWFFTQKQWLAGVATYLFAEVMRFGLVAFLFTACKDKLLSIPWFARLYALFVRAHEWAHAQVDPLKAQIRAALVEAGLIGGKGPLLRRLRALWRIARRGGAA